MKNIQDALKYKNELWKSNINEIVEYCENDEICIYGAGLYGGFVKEKLQEKNIKIKKFIVTSLLENQPLLDNIPVVEASKQELEDEKIIISMQSYFEVEKLLQRYGIYQYKILKVDVRIPVVKKCKDYLKYRQDVQTTFKDAMIRVRITNNCPGKCDFCGQLDWTEEEQHKEMNPKWYMEYMKPIYPILKTVLITGGDAFFARYSYDYMKMLSNEYRHITIFTESNGLAFTKRFQKLACENLFVTHFSLNASNKQTFVRGCWSSAGGDKAYEKCIENVCDYIQMLQQYNRIEFAPNISMVINSQTADDVVDFVKMALEMNTSYVIFFFDYQENDMSGEYFTNPYLMRKVLRQLLEIELLLKDKFYIQFRLWIPLKELDLVEAQMSNISMSELEEKYKDILKLAQGRNIEKEHNNRNLLRKENGKKELSFEEDYSLTLRTENINNKKVCASGWNMLDFYPNGRLDFCGWHVPILYFPDYIKNDKVDWNEIINSEEFQVYRTNMLAGDYSGCMSCCPIIRELKSF